MPGHRNAVSAPRWRRGWCSVGSTCDCSTIRGLLVSIPPCLKRLLNSHLGGLQLGFSGSTFSVLLFVLFYYLWNVVLGRVCVCVFVWVI